SRGAKNIVDLTAETVKGDPDILVSKELQVQLAYLHGGLRGQWGDALKIVGKSFGMKLLAIARQLA
ncbi:hypothetical protein BT69DRAFT_1276878, partial [Atractiella rhizophila]